jgi:hypothetical protein
MNHLTSTRCVYFHIDPQPFDRQHLHLPMQFLLQADDRPTRKMHRLYGGFATERILLDGGELTAPGTAGQTVGTVTVSHGGRIVGKAPLTVTEDFKRSGFLDALSLFRGYLTGRAFLLTVPIFASLLLPYLYVTGSSRGRYGLRTVRRRRRIRYTKRHF